METNSFPAVSGIVIFSLCFFAVDLYSLNHSAFFHSDKKFKCFLLFFLLILKHKKDIPASTVVNYLTVQRGTVADINPAIQRQHIHCSSLLIRAKTGTEAQEQIS